MDPEKFENLPARYKLLVSIHEHGPQNFTTLLERLKMSRNTISRQLTILRNEALLEVEFQENKKVNFLTPKGKLLVLEIIGDEKGAQILGYQRVQSEIKHVRDQLLSTLGPISNHALIDCVQFYIEMEEFGFIRKVPNISIVYAICAILGRFNLKNTQNADLRRQSPFMALSEQDILSRFNIDQVDFHYWMKIWNEIKNIVPLYDQQNTAWYLIPGEMFCDNFIDMIFIRTRRGILQESLFENFHFSISHETTQTLMEFRNAWNLNLDGRLVTMLTQYISLMMTKFVEGHKGYGLRWNHLPTEPKALRELATQLEQEISALPKDAPNQPELYRTIHYVYAHLEDDKKAIYWLQQYQKICPDDLDMLVLLQFYYFSKHRYPEFLEITKQMDKISPGNVISLSLVAEYHMLQNEPAKALEIITLAEGTITQAGILDNYLPTLLEKKVKAYFALKEYHSAESYGEYLYYELQYQEDEIYKILTLTYTHLFGWEKMEDLCSHARIRDPYNPRKISDLYFALLMHKSFHKAKDLFTEVSRSIPEFLPQLEEIKHTLEQKVDEQKLGKGKDPNSSKNSKDMNTIQENNLKDENPLLQEIGECWRWVTKNKKRDLLIGQILTFKREKAEALLDQVQVKMADLWGGLENIPLSEKEKFEIAAQQTVQILLNF